MRCSLSYATIKMLSENIAEVIVNKDVVISLEMVEEFDTFVENTFSAPFGLIVNKINNYNYSFEALSCMASNPLLVGTAVVNYDDVSKDPINQVKAIRAIDNLNIEVFSGLELGWQDAKQWLESLLIKVEA